MSTNSLQLKHAQLTRVGHLDIPVPAALLGLDPEVVAGLSWAAPTWADGEAILPGLTAEVSGGHGASQDGTKSR